MVKPVKKFVGLANYAAIFRDPNSWKIAGNTAVYILCLLYTSLVRNSVRQLPPDACIAVKWSQCLKYCLSAEKVHFPILVLHFTEGRFWVLEAWSVRAGPKFCAVYLVRIPMMEGRSFSRERSCHAVFLRQ